MKIILFTCTLPLLLFSQSVKKEDGIRAFRDVASVLTSPRCLNCHVSVDHPLQGDDNHAHIMKVARGADGGGGNAAMRCTNCHQESNVYTPHAPPGAPGWRMPPQTTPMAWHGLSTGAICGALKDPHTNGKRSLAELVTHVTSDKIITWAWNPGPDRSVPPFSHDQFVAATKTWVAAGAPCPE
jgi:hypothetical protein